MNGRPFSESLFVARCVKVAVCDYEVARCEFVARQSHASKSRDKIAGVTSVININRNSSDNSTHTDG